MAEQDEPRHSPSHHSKRWYHRHPEAIRPQSPVKNVKPSSSKKSLSVGELVQGIGALVFTVVFAFVGLMDIFPIYVNLIVYIVCLVVLLREVWKGYQRILVCFFVVIVYCGVLEMPIVKQYRKENSIQVAFKESPSLTLWRRQVIKHDLTGVTQYLKDLDIEVPASMPPLSVQSGDDSHDCSSLTPPEMPVYRYDISVGDAGLEDRSKVTLCYFQYILMRYKPYQEAEENRIADRALMDFTASNYFNSSYWATPPSRKLNIFLDVLWSIRSSLGKDFADRLVSAAWRSSADNPGEGESPDLKLYLATRVKIGESVVDDECAHWAEIEEAIQTMGVTRESLQQQNFENSAVSASCIEKWGDGSMQQ